MKKLIAKKIEIYDLDSGKKLEIAPKEALEAGAVRYHRSPVTKWNDLDLRLDKEPHTDQEPVGLLIKFLELAHYDGVIRLVYNLEGGKTSVVDTLYVYVGEHRETSMTVRKWFPRGDKPLWDKQVRNWIHIWVYDRPVAFTYRRHTGRGNVYSGEYVPSSAS